MCELYVVMEAQIVQARNLRFVPVEVQGNGGSCIKMVAKTVAQALQLAGLFQQIHQANGVGIGTGRIANFAFEVAKGHKLEKNVLWEQVVYKRCAASILSNIIQWGRVCFHTKSIATKVADESHAMLRKIPNSGN